MPSRSLLVRFRPLPFTGFSAGPISWREVRCRVAVELVLLLRWAADVIGNLVATFDQHIGNFIHYCHPVRRHLDEI